VRETVRTDKAPAAIGPYSQAIRSGAVLFCSGQIPLDPATGKMVDGGIESQTERVLCNLAAVLEAGGASLGSVAKTTVYLVDLSDFPAMNKVYRPRDHPGGETSGGSAGGNRRDRVSRMNQRAFDIRPDLMHCVHAWTRRTVPLVTVFTRCTFGFHCFRDRLLAWETLFPKLDPFPQIEHLAMVSSVIKTLEK